jgi:plasmid stabilization system protein ParE
MKYALVISPEAESDAEACVVKLKRHSLQGAATWYTAFRAAAKGLIDDAEVHAIVPRRGLKKSSIRSKPFSTPHGKTYQLYYRIQDAEVRVLRVWSPGQRSLRRKDLS